MSSSDRRDVQQVEAPVSEVQRSMCLSPPDPASSKPNLDNKPEWTDEAALSWLQKEGNVGGLRSLRDADPLMRISVHFVAHKGPTSLLRYVIQKTDMADAKDKHGRTALHFACESGRVTNTQALLNHFLGVSGGKRWFNPKDDTRMTPLMLASAAGYDKIVALYMHPLVLPHLDLLEKDMDGKNVLHHAASGGHTSCIRLLLQQEPTLLREKDSHGRTPVILAQKHPATVAFLKNYRHQTAAAYEYTPIIVAVAAFTLMAIGLILSLVWTSDIA